LGEAMGKGFLTVTEVSQSGTVPELKMVNKGDLPVLLLDGEELAGAKQNRVLNTTILLMEKSETIIPVSCTEHGRWSYATSAFEESGNSMSQNIRAKKASSVHQTLKEGFGYHGNQGEVWDGIQHLSVEAKAHSQTGAMKDVYENKKRDLEGYMKAFQYVPRQKGILVMINGRVMGLDILSQEPV
jgi:ARG and Rhodanese-Phosphatase-superfamily-associated Protein domain